MSRLQAKVLGYLSDAAPAAVHASDMAFDLGVASGSLYPSLKSLAGDGLVEASWGARRPGARPTKTYRITSEGIAFLVHRISDESDIGTVLGLIPRLRG